ncbi:MAG: anti-sigma factor, partial [Glaciecola sp.]
MNYNNDTLRNALAAEYVLGTLRGGARRRFKQIIMTNKTVAATVWEWEQYVNGLGESLPPVSPDKRVWELIQTRLGFDTVLSNVTPLITKPKKKFSLNKMMIAASFMLAILFTSMQFRDDFVPVSQFAVVNDEALNPLWLIEVADDELIV